MNQAGSLAATVVVPTSGDRGPTLTLAVESVLRQTIRDLEVFIIGDGAAEVTKRAAQALAQADPRVRFFDHPKHVRRGEPYRHAALAEARGRIVCYLVDRDLYLPDHVEEMSRLLEAADMAHSFLFKVDEHSYRLKVCLDVSHPEDRRILATTNLGIPLGHGAHTMEAYRRMNEGWVTTPEEHVTDAFFWAKFARDPAMRCVGGLRPTVLNFPSGSRPGWGTAQRLLELQRWSDRVRLPAGPSQIRTEIMAAALLDRAARCRKLRDGIAPSAAPTPAGSVFARVFRKLKGLSPFRS